MGDLSPEMIAKTDHMIKIPMQFCVNVGVAGALTMYDRLISMGRFPDRPVKAGGPEINPDHLPKGHAFNQPKGHRRKIRKKVD